MFLEFIKQYPFLLAFLLGLIPALFWLWFWLKEDTHPEPAKMITLSFLGGIASVLLALPLQKIILDLLTNSQTISFIIFASIEETIKLILVYLIALRYKSIVDEPVDDIIYLIIAALGFVTFENTLFLVEPIRLGNITETLVTSNFRFVGASLVHVVSSATVGIFMSFAFFRESYKKIIYTIVGLFCAIALHSSFNLLIINEQESHLIYIFGGVWFCAIVVMLLFEKIKKMSDNVINNIPLRRDLP